jgi:PHD/YefM family antitoxin component YafN of YafNO toxin-antitoxin module
MVSILNKPSSLIHEICIEKVDLWKLFKFSESLQQRMEQLLEKKKADQLIAEEIAELEAIEELDRIFTHINAMMVAQSDWASVQETLYLLSVPGMRESIREGMATPIQECDRHLEW